METINNRMERKARVTVDAPPVAVPGRVLPCDCPHCGRRVWPKVLRTFPAKGYADVMCESCAAGNPRDKTQTLRYLYATKEHPVPRLDYVPR